MVPHDALHRLDELSGEGQEVAQFVLASEQEHLQVLAAVCELQETGYGGVVVGAVLGVNLELVLLKCKIYGCRNTMLSSIKVSPMNLYS